MGAALAELAKEWDESFPDTAVGYAAGFAVLSVNSGLSVMDALHGYAWSWCENQVLIATRAVPLGHLAGQRLLRQVMGDVGQSVESSTAIADEQIGLSASGYAIASMLHETQYSRQFRS